MVAAQAQCSDRPGKILARDKSGERGRNRTYNLLIKSQLLCQLSYAPGGYLRRNLPRIQRQTAVRNQQQLKECITR